MADSKSPVGCMIFNTKIVEFKIGVEENLIGIHQSLLIDKIDFFRKMFHASFEESNSKQVVIPDMPMNVMLLIWSWIYNGSITPIGKQLEMARELSAHGNECNWLAVERMYHIGITFAERWLCTPLARELFCRIREHHGLCKRRVDYRLVHDTVSKLSVASTFRQWLLDLTWAQIQSDEEAFQEFCTKSTELRESTQLSCHGLCKKLSTLQSKTEQVCDNTRSQLEVLEAALGEDVNLSALKRSRVQTTFEQIRTALTNLQCNAKELSIDLDSQVDLMQEPEAERLKEVMQSMFRVGRGKKAFDDVLSQELYLLPKPAKTSSEKTPRAPARKQ